MGVLMRHKDRAGALWPLILFLSRCEHFSNQRPIRADNKRSKSDNMWLPADSESSSRANTDAGTSNDGAKTATLQLDLKQLIEQLQAAQNPVPVDNSTRGATRGGAAAAPSLYPTGAGVVAIDLDAQSVKVTLTDGSIRLRVSRPAAPDIRPTRSYTKGSYP